jgi:arabinofuranosyltransferase
MLGRFLTPSLFAGLVIIGGSISLKNRNLLKKVAASFIILFAFPFVIKRAYETFVFYTDIRYKLDNEGNIEDEVTHYSAYISLPKNCYKKLTHQEIILTHFRFKSDDLKRQKYTKVQIEGGIGYLGYSSGPNNRIIDKLGLGDPLLSRLPMYPKRFRTGHLQRIIPDGYVETVYTGKNLIKDKNVAEYYDKIKIITQEPVFSKGRFNVIINMMRGKYDYLLEGKNFSVTR